MCAASFPLFEEEGRKATLQRLLDMRYSQGEAVEALEKNDYDFEKSILWLSGSSKTAKTPYDQIKFGPSLKFNVIGSQHVMIGSNKKLAIIEDPSSSHSSEKLSPEPKSCFVSYYADTTAERNRILSLTNELRLSGIDAMMDIYSEDDPPKDWPEWIKQEMKLKDVILVMCSEKYMKNLDDRKSVHQRQRVHFEGQLIHHFLTTLPSERFVPVFLGEETSPREELVPAPIRQNKMYHVRKFPLELGKVGHEGFTELYAFLSGQNFLLS